ncbi:toll/interleukin-1 receptor domain-containing protein [Saccharothrix sp. 6-C]|uniref:toll/interleukin-1 receptor domain-containing protein n=1 Tax=Saccharothrix sp. 6-C TaxID=2781735 RepID=UPI0019172F60|nr:toll/interleukin-1 receptor domain-containing protein [Saccharothrix sp. 6-C]
MPSDEVKHVFVSYVREDAEKVDQLCQALEAADIPYWRDRTSLAPGDHWKRKIREAIRSGALVFLACFSEHSQAKARSYMNEELSLAVEEFRILPPGATWIIPVRLDDVNVPEWDLGAGRTLNDLNYADLFGSKYVANLVGLTNTISKIVGATSPDPATVRASVEEASDAERPAMLRRMTKEMIVDPARRIELDNLVLQEVQRVLEAMRDEAQFPTQRLEGTAEDQMVRCAEVAADYWRLAEAFCASLQVAVRWTNDPQELTPWASGLRALAGEALKLRGGNKFLLDLRHVPALTATFTVALAAVGQSRWKNLRTLLVDISFPGKHQELRDPLLMVEYPWAPFRSMGERLPKVVAGVAKTGNDPRAVLNALMDSDDHDYDTPIAEWLHAILRPHFRDQYPDDAMYDNFFDRAEVMLGLISQIYESARYHGELRENPEVSVPMRYSKWLGRSVWRADSGLSALEEIASEMKSQGRIWPPLSEFFDGRHEYAVGTLGSYTEAFNRFKSYLESK